eukprot:15478221-Alexandrium_andersonii.AAC.1
MWAGCVGAGRPSGCLDLARAPPHERGPLAGCPASPPEPLRGRPPVRWRPDLSRASPCVVPGGGRRVPG